MQTEYTFDEDLKKTNQICMQALHVKTVLVVSLLVMFAIIAIFGLNNSSIWLFIIGIIGELCTLFMVDSIFIKNDIDYHFDNLKKRWDK